MTPITNMMTELRRDYLELIAVDARFTCYALKTGKIRVLSQTTGNKALLEGHTSPLTAIRFLDARSGLVASVSRAGDVAVHQIDEDIDTGDAAVTERRIMLMNVPNLSDEASPSKLCWHSKEVLLAAAGDRIALFILQDAAILQAKPAAEAQLPSGNVTSLAVSSCGRHLAISTSAGHVHIWELPGTPSGMVFTFRDLPPPNICWKPSHGDAATHVAFMPSEDSDAAPQRLLVGCDKNRKLSLWAVTPAYPKAELQQTVEFQGTDVFNQLALCPHAPLLVAANTNSRQLCALHYSGTRCRLDYAAAFSVAHPILSLAFSPAAVEDYQLYCLQTEAIQQYALKPAACTPPSAASGAQPPAAVEPKAAAAAPVQAPAAAAAGPAANGADGSRPTPVSSSLPTPITLLTRDSKSSASQAASTAAAAAAPPSTSTLAPEALPPVQQFLNKKLLKKEQGASASAAAQPAATEAAPATPAASQAPNPALMDLLRSSGGKSFAGPSPSPSPKTAAAADSTPAAAEPTAPTLELLNRRAGRSKATAAVIAALESPGDEVSRSAATPAAAAAPEPAAKAPAKAPANKAKSAARAAPQVESPVADATAASSPAAAAAVAVPAASLDSVMAGMRAEMATAMQVRDAPPVRLHILPLVDTLTFAPPYYTRLPIGM